MQANELRLGNWILSPDTNRYVVVELNHLKAIDDGVTFNGKHYDGILLTREILESCGFKIIDNNYYWTIGFEEHKVVFNIDAEGGLSDNNRVKYLHQLQNIHFALTGTELEVKLPAFA